MSAHQDFDQIRDALELPDASEIWRATWDESRDEDSGFLDKASLEEALCFIQMTPEVASAYRDARSHLDENAALKRLAWHCHCLLFEPPLDMSSAVSDWPMMPVHLGDAGRLFYGLVLISGVPRLRELHQARGIAEEVTVDTLSDLEVWTRVYREKYGCWGLEEREWLSRHLGCRLFKLGRLQFEMTTFPPDVHTSRGREAEVECVLKKGTPILNVHIQAGVPLEHAACVESYRWARVFFAKHFPEWSFDAYHCDTWLLAPQLAEYLPAASNIIRFQRDWRLLPSPDTSGRQIVERAFGCTVDDPLKETARTSLQRAIIEHIRKGGHWRNGAGLIFPEDLEGLEG